MAFNLELGLALASGIAVSAACGLRAFLPLLALGAAGRLGWIELQSSVSWLESTPALVCFGLATLLEVLGDKVPVLDHALDVVATFVRPATAWLAGFAVLTHWPSPWAQIIAVAFGGSALAVHALKAKTRLGSTAVTLGHGNPVLSVLEDFVTIVILAAVILAPLIAVAAVVALIAAFMRGRRRPQPA